MAKKFPHGLGRAPSAGNQALSIVLIIVVVYGLALVAAPLLMGAAVFDVLGFGPDAAGVPEGEPRQWLKMVFGVVGSVLVGWAATMLILAAGPLRNGDSWAWYAIAVSVTLWFMLDTGMSIVYGWWQHGLFNVPFYAAIMVPMAMTRADLR